MNKYANYHTISANWLKDIPVHWEFKRIGSLFFERVTKVSDKDFLPLSVTKAGILPQLSTVAKSDAGDNRKLVCRGDFVINSRSDRKGSCGTSSFDGSVSLINTVLTPRNQLDGMYAHYLLRSALFTEEFYRNGRGIVSDLWTTRFREMKTICIPVPPIEEQNQIVRFLDWKVSSINQLINNKIEQIAEYKSLIRAEIEHQMLTYPAIIECRLKNLGQFFKGGGFSRENLVQTSECPALLYGDIYTQYEYETSEITHFIDGESYLDAPKLSYGDIVMAGTGETKDEIGKPILYSGNQSVAVGGDVIVFRPNSEVCKQFLLYQLYNDFAFFHRYIYGKGDIIVHIGMSALGNIRISLPSLSNQEKAAKRINNLISRVAEISKQLEAEIVNLKELKDAIISEVVTGKIDVRNVVIPEYEYIPDIGSSELADAKMNEEESDNA